MNETAGDPRNQKPIVNLHLDGMLKLVSTDRKHGI